MTALYLIAGLMIAVGVLGIALSLWNGRRK